MLPDLSRQKTTPVVGRSMVFAVSVMLKTSLVSTHRTWTLPPGDAQAAAAPVEGKPEAPDNVIGRVVHRRNVRHQRAEQRGDGVGCRWPATRDDLHVDGRACPDVENSGPP